MTTKEDQWILTYSGKQFFPFNPKLDQICIQDIAHALSMICRYTGHVKQFYSVAQHSCYVSDYCPQELKLYGLLHDATEAYLADINRPTKEFLPDYKKLEQDLELIIISKYLGMNSNLELSLPDYVKQLDMAILNNEREVLLPESKWDWGIGNQKLDLIITPWSPAEAEKEFLERFMRLY